VAELAEWCTRRPRRKDEDKGFVGSLFDVGFHSFVTKIVTVLFVISLVLSGLYTIFIVASAFAADSGAGVVGSSSPR
jgi:hypothetical protein